VLAVRGIVGLLLCLMALVAVAQAPGPASPSPSPDGQRSVASYVAVEAGQDAAAVTALKAYAAGVRLDPAAQRVLLLTEIGRPGQFVLLESWRDEAAWLAHAAAPSRRALEQALQSFLLAPFDDRLGLPMQREAPASEPRDALHVVLHVDVTGTGIDTMPETLRETAGKALRMPGAIAFEIATQSNKRNHFTVHEIWASRAAYDAYNASATAKEFRARFHQVKGAVYDDRLFTQILP
jgi:quinol monooxygenase YgiN